MTNSYEKLSNMHLHPAGTELDAPRFTLTVQPAASQSGFGGGPLGAEFPGGK